MNTLCEHCIFAKKRKGKQVGCHLNRLDIFKARDKAVLKDNGMYDIQDYCSTCRNIYWNHYKPSINKSSLVEKVLDEVKIKYGLVISIDGENVFNLDKTIDSCNKLSIKPWEITLCGQINEENMLKAQYYSDKNIMVNLNRSDDKFTQTQKYLQDTTCQYILFGQAGLEVDCDFDFINNLATIDMTPLVYHYTNDWFLVATFLYRAHIYEPNPITYITENYGTNGQPKSKCTNS